MTSSIHLIFEDIRFTVRRAADGRFQFHFERV